MGNISLFRGISLSSGLVRNPLFMLAVDSGGAAQIVVKGGHVFISDGTIAAPGSAVLYIFNESVCPEIGHL